MSDSRNLYDALFESHRDAERWSTTVDFNQKMLAASIRNRDEALRRAEQCKAELDAFIKNSQPTDSRSV
jgi:hypothetical protein